MGAYTRYIINENYCTCTAQIHSIFLYNFDRVITEAELHDVLNIKDKHLPHSSVNLQN